MKNNELLEQKKILDPQLTKKKKKNLLYEKLLQSCKLCLCRNIHFYHSHPFFNLKIFLT